MAIQYGLYWFVFAEVIKVLMAAGVARAGAADLRNQICIRATSEQV